ncbi:MAG: beta-ribofuranosylaminobenzene 5'-phosphate synthase family protein [Gammaproteobacteria bacterium]
MTASVTHPASTADDDTTYVVHAPARLHLGFVDLNGDLGRRFGSLGLAIDGLGTRVRAAPAARLVVDAADADTTARVTALLTRLCAALAPGRALHVGIESSVPVHAGLGSGTQLALAVAQAATRALGVPASLRELASFGERGLRSGIGIAAFEGGGFVVDGGRGAQTTSPPLLARLRFPDDWRCVLVFDDALTGLSGQRERAAFASLAPMSEAAAGALARQVLVALLPALVERDFAAFSRAVAAVQRANGEYFAPAQGGPYTSARVGDLLAAVVREFGYTGIGQSSWGPTGFVFAPDAASAAAVASFVDARKAEGLRCQIVTGNNVGARCGLRGEFGVDPPSATPVWLIPHQRRGY